MRRPAVRVTGDPMGFRYTGIRVRDLDRSIDFYTRVLGMHVEWRQKIRETGGAIAILKSPRGSQRLELNWYPAKGMYKRYRQGDELDHLAFHVRDVDAFLKENKGEFKVVMKAFYEGNSRLAYVTGPDSEWIELMSPRKSARRR